jgi:hypothetical protein
MKGLSSGEVPNLIRFDCSTFIALCGTTLAKYFRSSLGQLKKKSLVVFETALATLHTHITTCYLNLLKRQDASIPSSNHPRK